MSLSALLDRATIRAEDDEKQALQEMQHALDEHGHARIVTDRGATIEMPESVYRALLEVVRDLLSGHSVTIVPMDSELTTNKAARFLNVSRPYLIGLLEGGAIPYHTVGSHRRIKFADLVRYKEQRGAERKRNIAELIALSEEAGMYAREDARVRVKASEG